MSAARSKERVPGYRLHKPTRQAVVTLNYRDHYLGSHGSPESRDAYRRLVADWLANGRRLPEKTVVRTITVAEVCDAFLTFCEKEYRDHDGTLCRSVVNVRLALRPLVAGQFATLLAPEFGPKALQCFREELIAAGLTRKTVNERVGLVRRAFRYATREELIQPSIYHGLQAVEGLRRGRGGARETEGVRPVPDDDVQKALPHMPATVQAMVRLQLLTACRPGEVIALRLCDLDRSGEVWQFRPHRHKNTWRGLDRVIVLGPQAQEVVRGFLKPGPQDAPLFSPAESERTRWRAQRERRQSPLWPSHQRVQERQKAGQARRRFNQSYSVASYRRAIARACKKAGVPIWSPGQLRHNAATEARRRFGLEAAAALLGHELVETTQIYSDTRLALAKEVAAKIG